MKKVKCEVYSRVVGFLRPIDSWNVGKRLEFDQRLTYDLGLAVKKAKEKAPE